jgi:hypothetical protein
VRWIRFTCEAILAIGGAATIARRYPSPATMAAR